MIAATGSVRSFEIRPRPARHLSSRPHCVTVRFDTIGPALEAGLPATVVVDRPVIQQVLIKHGFPAGSVRIKSRIETYEDHNGGVKATLADGTVAYGDVLVGADGVWSQIRKVMHGLGDGAGGFAASGAAGGALDEAEARKLARDTVRIAAKAERRFSGFTCYAALANHKASNIEEVSYQILLGSDKYFVSTDAGAEINRRDAPPRLQVDAQRHVLAIDGALA